MIGITELRAICRVTGTTHDQRLAALEIAAVDHLQRETGRFFGPTESVTEWITGDGTDTLWLRDHANEAIATVDERSAPGGTATTITAGNDDGYLQRTDDLTKLVRRNGLAWTLGYEYEVTYERGYDSGEEPKSARQIVEQLVAWWFERRVPAPRPGESAGAFVPHHVSRLLDGLRRLHV